MELIAEDGKTHQQEGVILLCSGGMNGDGRNLIDLCPPWTEADMVLSVSCRTQIGVFYTFCFKNCQFCQLQAGFLFVSIHPGREKSFAFVLSSVFCVFFSFLTPVSSSES